MVFSELRTLAFRIAPEVKTLPHQFVTLGIPEDLKQLLRRELAIALNRDPEKTRLRISVLNKAVRMLVPDLISIARNADETAIQPWLYGSGQEPASSLALQQIMKVVHDGGIGKLLAQINRHFRIVVKDQRLIRQAMLMNGRGHAHRISLLPEVTPPVEFALRPPHQRAIALGRLARRVAHSG